jgi:Type VI secretion system effector, Hcp
MQTSCLRLLRRVTIAVSIAFGVATPTAAMADLITLATPGIKGDVTAKGQEGTIEVLSLSNDVLVPVTGGARREGRAQVTPMIIHKRIDVPRLLCSLP